MVCSEQIVRIYEENTLKYGIHLTRENYVQCDSGFVKMMNEEWDELLRQDEEASFADKYAEELEMMDEMETGKNYHSNY